MRLKKPYRITTASIVIWVLVILISQSVTFGVPRGAPRPWTSVEPGSLGAVNLFNGSLSMGIPLMTLGGRGETQVPMVLRLNRPWTKRFYTYLNNPPYPFQHIANCELVNEGDAPDTSRCVTSFGYATNTTSQTQVNTMVMARLDEEAERAWQFSATSYGTLGYGPGILSGKTMIGNSTQCQRPLPPPGQEQEWSYRPVATRFSVTFTTADGEAHELVDTATFGKFRVNTSTQCGQYSPDSLFSRGDTFVSTDGSRLTLVLDDEITDDTITTDNYGGGTPLALSGLLRSPDGSVYRFDGGLISWIEDRNGNRTALTYTSAGTALAPKKLQSVTDSLGRLTTIEYDVQDIEPYGLCDRIIFDGIGGLDTIIRISKRPLNSVLRAGDSIQRSTDIWPATCQGSDCGIDIDPTVESAVWLPDGSAYKFQYNSFVEVARVQLPTGGAVEYDHDYAVSGLSNYEHAALARVVTEKRVFTDVSNVAGSLETKTKYSRSIDSAGTTVTVDQTDPSDVLFSRQVSYFYGNPSYGYQASTGSAPYGMRSWKTGEEYQTKFYGQDGTTLLTRALRESVNNTVPWISNQINAPTFDPRPVTWVSLFFEAGKALAVIKRAEYDMSGSSDPAYFSHLNVKAERQYNYKTLDFGIATSGSLSTIAAMFSDGDVSSISQADYLYDANYRDKHIIGLPLEKRIVSPTNLAEALAKTRFVYDEAAYFDNTYTTTNWENPNTVYRGNVTTTRTWAKETDTWLDAHTMYDTFGNVRRVWDLSGDPTRFVETLYDVTYNYGFATKVITPAPDSANSGHSTTETSTVETAYDYSTGLPTSIKDDFGQITATEYDYAFRPIRVKPIVIDGVATGPITENIYGTPNSNGDVPSDQRFVKFRKQLDSVNWDESIAWSDGLSRTIKTQVKDSRGDVFVERFYDNLGRVARVTNPYRAADTVYWSKTRYDSAGRPVEMFAPATINDINANNLISVGTRSFDISTVANFIGTVVTTTDASGRKGRSITNALGHLLRVDEATGVSPNPTTDLGGLESPNQPTVYTYDLYGKLVRVQQGTQNRYFKYDSLGRLIRFNQPEQETNTALDMPDSHNLAGHWTAGFTYDALGNVLTATDANGTTITNTYDRANRLTTRTYSGEPSGQTSTPTVNFYYDGKGLDQEQSLNYAKGKLTKIENTISRTRYTRFDKLGRLLSMEQRTPYCDQTTVPECTETVANTTPHVSTYTYTLSGALKEETYPTGRVVKNEYEPDGALLSVVSRKSGAAFFLPYASDFSYTASGGISQMKFGNGRWETAKFNERLQITELGLGASAADTGLWKVNYDYGEIEDSGALSIIKNTGNIARQTLTVFGTSFAQNYRYDPLSRVKEAKETTGENQNWIQNWTYDRYGNRQTFTQNIAGNPNSANPAVSAYTNRFADLQTFGYDKNGNLIKDIDGATSSSRNFVFNGENKQTEVRLNGMVKGRYYYDGEGKRVKKVTDTETTIFIYSAGKLVAESSIQLAQQPFVGYISTDHLGSPRILTDEFGHVKSRRDFLPFGEEIQSTVGLRSSLIPGYGVSDGMRQRFTGYHKDGETNLDFADARMYDSRVGRFTAVDPLLTSGSSAKPQSFNRYAYGLNDPIVMIDSNGLYPVYYLEKGGKLSYSTVKEDSTWTRYKGATHTFISIANNSTKGKLVTVSRRSMTVIPTGLETDQNARASAQHLNELDSRQREMIRSLATNSLQKGKLVAVLAGGAVLVGTGTGFYLYAAGATTATLIDLGIAGEEFGRRHPNALQGFIDFFNKPGPQGLVVNLGGKSANPAAVNIDINRLSNVPNFIQGNASNIQTLLQNSQWAGQKVAQLEATQFTSVNMNWVQFSNQAFKIMDSGGKVMLNIHGARSLEIINNEIVPALQNAGFTNINVYQNVVTAIR